jgi:hypothetical protein
MVKTGTQVFLILSLISLVACSANLGSNTSSTPFQDAEPESISVFNNDRKVTLQQSTIQWETYRYELTEQFGIVTGSYDGVNKTQRTFQTLVLENEYLRVTLIPEFGGRIISIFYKPTGHEELYQNPVGVPYQIGTGIFYYDWLMVYGGIFPTFPEPEHGKTWLLPWDFQIVNESDQEVTVKMSFKDEIDNPNAPGQYDLGPTGLELAYYVTLKSGRAAVDTEIQITNPGHDSVEYEYWTNATLAPGSDPLDPGTTAGAEIIAPINQIKIPRYWASIAAQENAAGLSEVYAFMNLKQFQNWPDMGIAYAFPDLKGRNFWGVINHDLEEGIFRIADNTVTPGLKMWTWGFPQSMAVDPLATANEARPYIELWAGVTREFWQRTSLPARETLVIEEIYSPSVGLTNVTHANENFLVNITPGDSSSITCQIFGLFPDQTIEIFMVLDDQEIYNATERIDPETGNDCSTEVPEWSFSSVLVLTIEGPEDELLFEGELDFSVIE